MTDCNRYILTAHCPGRQGTIDAVTGFLAQQNCYVLEMASFDDRDTNRFFVRIEFDACSRLTEDFEGFTADLQERVEPFQMQWEIHDACRQLPVVIMVSKYD
ncbi:MAG: formyltetrahydrofolate deformylase, partial [Motiliproteus sp.]|nr:formyltetrahydrofolate deformylase [Motiliproteus sp.]